MDYTATEEPPQRGQTQFPVMSSHGKNSFACRCRYEVLCVLNLQTATKDVTGWNEKLNTHIQSPLIPLQECV